MFVSAFAQNYRFAGAIIDFKNESMPAHLSCDGKAEATQGVGLCQGRVGTKHSIGFDEKMKSASSPECGALSSEDGQEWTFPLTKGVCVYSFADPSGRVYRLTTYGYDEFQLAR